MPGPPSWTVSRTQPPVAAVVTVIGLFPLLAALVAGDIFANEDGHGTWKTILTRSASRGQVFAAKTLTAVAFNLLALLLLAASTIASSLLIVGTQPLPGLSGQLIPAGTALPLVAAAWTAVCVVIGYLALRRRDITGG
nr:hypothetical protein GCM10020063_023400 [Dactylosporangium thailandense]